METISNVGKVIADLGDVYVENAATPVIAGTINYNTGDADISHVKLTTGQNWATSISKGDPSITFFIGATDAATNAMFCTAVTQSESPVTKEVHGITLNGYSVGTVAKLTKDVDFVTKDGLGCIHHPKATLVGTLALSDDGVLGWNCSVIPNTDSKGADTYIGIKNNA